MKPAKQYNLGSRIVGTIDGSDVWNTQLRWHNVHIKFHDQVIQVILVFLPRQSEMP
jgi:hypothetical protein